MTAFSPNMAVLFLGWSIIEGLGAVLVIPAIAALIADNYEGRERITAFAVIGAVSGGGGGGGTAHRRVHDHVLQLAVRLRRPRCVIMVFVVIFARQDRREEPRDRASGSTC